MVMPILESLYCHTCLVDATRSRRTYAMTPKLETVRNRAVHEPLLGPGHFTLPLIAASPAHFSRRPRSTELGCPEDVLAWHRCCSLTLVC